MSGRYVNIAGTAVPLGGGEVPPGLRQVYVYDSDTETYIATDAPREWIGPVDPRDLSITPAPGDVWTNVDLDDSEEP